MTRPKIVLTFAALIFAWLNTNSAVQARQLATTTVTTLGSRTLRIGDSVSLAGYNRVNDGGGGTFDYVRAGTLKADGGTVINFDVGQLVRRTENKTVTPYYWGAAGNGVADDTEAVQKAIDWAVARKATVNLSGTLVIKDTIRICRVGAAQQVSIKMDPKLSFDQSGDCLVWDGAPNKPMVEIGIMQRSVVSLNVTNPKKIKGVTGLLWHNPNDKRTACNSNVVSLTACWCDLGMRWGDFTHDRYHSNVDDNEFPIVTFSRCNKGLLIDSNRQDNNVIRRFHSGGTGLPVGDRSRPYVIRANHNGNGFRIDKGFIHVGRMVPDTAVIDLRQGAFSCGSMSMETGVDAESNVLPLRIAGTIGRGQCVINDLYLDDRLRNSDGDCVVSDYRSGVTFTGCNFSGNVRTTRPMSLLGTVFQEGYGVKLVGNLAASIEMPLGTRASAGASIRPNAMLRGHGLVPRSIVINGGTVWPEFSRYSTFIVNVSDDFSIAKATREISKRDRGRRVTFIFRGGKKDCLASWDTSFSLNSGKQKMAIEAGSVSVVDFVSDGEIWHQASSN